MFCNTTYSTLIFYFASYQTKNSTTNEVKLRSSATLKILQEKKYTQYCFSLLLK